MTTSPRRRPVSIVTVTWNSAETIGDLLSTIEQRDELIVVDNDSSDATRELVAADSHARLIASPVNVGFGAACNLGARDASGDVLVFLNPDTRPSPGAIDALAAGVEAPAVGLLLPALSSSPAEVRDTVSLFPSPLSAVAEAFGLWKLAKRIMIGPGRRVRVPWGFGACMVTRRDVFDALGGFDERIFLYGEDMDLCRRVHDLGYDVILDTNILIDHDGNASGSQAFTPTARALLVLQAEYRFLTEFHTRRYAELTFMLRRLLFPLRRLANPDLAVVGAALEAGGWRSAPARNPSTADARR